jgi:SanA protein
VIIKMTKVLLKTGFCLALAGGLVLGSSRLFTDLYAQSRVYTADNAPTAPVAIVFGAGLRRDGGPTPVLRDRIDTAVELYRAGKVKKLLMSGDNRFVDYNEPGAMKAYAIQLGMPEQDIVLDYAGRRTYDTCYRAKHIFGVEQALVVTQRFHLPRAVYTCNALGIQASGVLADRGDYGAVRVWETRELAATPVALWELWVVHPLPVLGKPEPIFSKTSPQMEIN